MDMWLYTWNDVLDYLNKKFVNLTKESTSPDFEFQVKKSQLEQLVFKKLFDSIYPDFRKGFLLQSRDLLKWG